MYLKIIVVAYFTSALTVEAAKILAVFPTPSISHQIVFRPLTLELAKRGHEVVVITTDPAYPAGAPENLTEIDVRYAYEGYKKTRAYSLGYNEDDIKTRAAKIFSRISAVFYNQLKTDAVEKIIRDKNIDFDLLIFEAWMRQPLAFSHRFNVPVIRFGSAGAFLTEYQVMGSFAHPFYYPLNLCGRCTSLENLTWSEKIREIYNYIHLVNLSDGGLENENEIMRTYFGSDMPDLNELSNNVDLLISNVHRAMELNCPMPLSVVKVGGIHLRSECTLSEDLKNYLDSSANGVVYVSFGTNTKTSRLDPKKIEMMISVLSRLPHDVLWKWDEDEMPGRKENIKISKWLPQECLLKHPKIKLFVTQGGLQSTDEAIAAGVPLVGVPLDSDQFGNVRNYVRHKIGTRVLFYELNEESFEDAINSVLNDESFLENVVRLRDLLQDLPLSPLQRAVWWTEYVLRHGGAKQLRAPAANMSWSQYYELELLLIILLVVLVQCCLLYSFLKILIRYLWKICVKYNNNGEIKFN
ncbi:UDP-glycosyltransferase UGT5-like [Aphomia sociella]